MLDLKQNDRINIELQYITLNEKIMNNVSYEAICFTQLSAEDISNPFLVLQEIFGEDVSPEVLQDECWELFAIAFRPNYWMKYESPLELYKKYKKMVRLLEAGWLIYNIRPSYMMKGEIAETFPCEHDTFSYDMLEKLDDVSRAYKMLIRLYNDNMLIFYRVDLFEILLEGLNAKCQQGEPYIGEIVFGRFKEINALIEILHTIMLVEKDRKLTETDICILNRYEKKALENQECLIYEGNLGHVIGYFKTKQDLKEMLKSCDYLLYKNNYWEWHSNPGKVIFYFQHFLFTLEIYWLHVMRVNANNRLEELVWEIPEESAMELNALSKEDIVKPWKYIKDKFTSVPLAKWRSDLKQWEEAVLSNKEFYFSNSTEFERVKKFLEILIEMADLKEYFPQFEDTD